MVIEQSEFPLEEDVADCVVIRFQILKLAIPQNRKYICIYVYREHSRQKLTCPGLAVQAKFNLETDYKMSKDVSKTTSMMRSTAGSCCSPQKSSLICNLKAAQAYLSQKARRRKPLL